MKQLLVIASLALFCGSSFGQTASKRMIGTRPLPAMTAEAFTIVIIPDTQSYTGKGCKATPQSTDPVTNANLEAQVKWIREHRDDQNIVFISHVGDIVDKNNADQWAVAKQHLDQLRGVVPFSLTVGNHDMTSKGDATLFQKHFPAASFTTYPWYLGSYAHTRSDQNVSANNVNSAQLFSAGGIDFIHLSLECNAPDDVLAWAGETLTKHARRHALITTHMDLGIREKPKTTEGYIHDPKGRMNWIKIHGARGNTGEQMWDKLYRKHASLRLIFCGDQSRVTALKLTTPADDGHPITSMLSDYMSQPVLRLLRFVPAENRIHALTYDVKQQVLVEDTPHVHDLEQHQFTLDYPMK
ncbi:MAG TPA: serine/threonine protein phosphatase [Verrucomicrobiales bacterium]|nr:serine/threonine protein phosphatase [Verrucomicrobiales bacterium]